MASRTDSAPRRPRAVAATGLGLALVLVAGASAGAPGARALRAPQHAAPCATGDLRVSLHGSSGAAGSVYHGLVFVNRGAAACSLTGYPGVSFVRAGGRQAGAAARRDATHVPRRVVLAPGGRASAVLRIARAANFPSATCRPVHVRGLRVYPPDQRRSAIVRAPQTACSNPAAGQLGVTVVLAGAPQL